MPQRRLPPSASLVAPAVASRLSTRDWGLWTGDWSSGKPCLFSLRNAGRLRRWLPTQDRRSPDLSSTTDDALRSPLPVAW